MLKVNFEQYLTKDSEIKEEEEEEEPDEKPEAVIASH